MHWIELDTVPAVRNPTPVPFFKPNVLRPFYHPFQGLLPEFLPLRRPMEASVERPSDGQVEFVVFRHRGLHTKPLELIDQGFHPMDRARGSSVCERFLLREDAGRSGPRNVDSKPPASLTQCRDQPIANRRELGGDECPFLLVRRRADRPGSGGSRQPPTHAGCVGTFLQNGGNGQTALFRGPGPRPRAHRRGRARHGFHSRRFVYG